MQFNEQGFEALNLMIVKSEKSIEEDPVSYAAFKALETSEILLVSEYSYEVTMNTKFKS